MNSKIRTLGYSSILLLAYVSARAEQSPWQGPNSHALQVRSIPAVPVIEMGHDAQLLNFDFAFTNPTADAFNLIRIVMTAYDVNGRPIQIRTIEKNGFPSSLETIPNRDLKGHSTLGVFNPIYSFPPDLDFNSLKYEFDFNSSHGSESLEYVVNPLKYETKTRLQVPVKGHLMVVDGHDFYSHHRRQDLSNPAVIAAGVTANPVRYALDIVYVDSTGALYHGDPRDKRNWIGYGKPVYAPGTGRVVALVNDVSERTWDGQKLDSPPKPADASPFGFGNYVEIDHGNGEYSFVAHLVPGSVLVKLGDEVKGGQVIGRLGTSDAGDETYAVEPHVHYMLMNGANVMTSEGLPAYFGPFSLVRGTHLALIARGALDTGDIFEVQ